MPKPRILIVEDEEIVRADLTNKLIQLGYEICGGTARGEEAIGLARDERPDLVLMDIRLAGQLDGVETADIIRRECDLPVVFLTAHSDRATLERAKHAEPFGYILKPFETTDLETHIEMALYKHQAERKLRENEFRLSSLVRSAMDAIIAVDAEQRIVLFNPAAERIFGCAFSDARGSSLDRFIPAQFREAHRKHLEEFGRTGATSRCMWALGSLNGLRTNGEEFPIEASISRTGDGHPQMFTVILRDITERKRAEEKIRKLNAVLEQRVSERTAKLRELTSRLIRAEELERRRVAQVLHEGLQQMLVGAMYNLESLQGQIRNPSARQGLRAVQDIINESIRVSRSLTHELSPPVLYQENLADILEWLSRWFKDQHGLSVRVEIRQPLEVAIEEIRVTVFRGVLELLFNIVKHARVKNALVSLDRNQDGTMRIEVSDAGVGFDASLTHARAGTDKGFGLFHLRERLDLLGGSLEIDSVPGRGSRFVLLVPLPSSPSAAPPEPKAAPGSSVTARQELPPPGGQAIRVLLADDHPMIRDGLIRVLQEETGIEVVGQAGDGLQAVRLARVLRPDVVIMAASMPHLNGIEATQLLATELPKVKVIGLSMFETDPQGREMLQAGAVAFLNKSAATSDLVKAIRDCMDTR